MGTARERECGSGDWPEREREGKSEGVRKGKIKEEGGQRKNKYRNTRVHTCVHLECLKPVRGRRYDKHVYEQERGGGGHKSLPDAVSTLHLPHALPRAPPPCFSRTPFNHACVTYLYSFSPPLPLPSSPPPPPPPPLPPAAASL